MPSYVLSPLRYRSYHYGRCWFRPCKYFRPFLSVLDSASGNTARMVGHIKLPHIAARYDKQARLENLCNDLQKAAVHLSDSAIIGAERSVSVIEGTAASCPVSSSSRMQIRKSAWTLALQLLLVLRRSNELSQTPCRWPELRHISKTIKLACGWASYWPTDI